MTSPSALLAIQDGSGSTENQGQGYIQQLVPGDTVKFTLQSTAGITPQMRWVLVFESVDTPNLNGLEFTWSPNNSGNLPEFDFLLPPGGFTARYYTSVQDPQNVLSTFTGEIYGNGAGITVTPAPSNGQAIVWNGSGYEPQGIRVLANVLAEGADPFGDSTGFNSQPAIMATIAAATSQSDVYLPAGYFWLFAPVVNDNPSVVSIRGESGHSIADGTRPSQAFRTTLATFFHGDALVVTPLPNGGGSTAAYTHYTTGGDDFYFLQLFESQEFPYINLSMSQCGDVSGSTALRWEGFVDVPLGDGSLWGYASSAGNRGTEALASAFTFRINPSAHNGTAADLSVSITTTVSGKVVCSGGSVSAGLHKLAASYDGAFLRLWLDGVFVAHVACTGTIVQKPWETFLCGAEPTGWPDGPHGVGAGPYLIGPQRLCKTSSAVSATINACAKFINEGTTYTPETSDAAFTANDDVYTSWSQTFIPANTTAFARGQFAIGTTHLSPFGTPAPWPVYSLLRGSVIQASSCEIRDLGIITHAGGILTNLAPSGKIDGCSVTSNLRCITLENNSYNTNVSNCRLNTSVGGSAHSWCCATVNASGNGVIRDMVSQGGLYGYISGGGANLLENIYHISVGLGAAYWNAVGIGGLATAAVHWCDFSDESGNVSDSTFFVSGFPQFEMTQGIVVSATTPGAPVATFDAVGSVTWNGSTWIGSGSQAFKVLSRATVQYPYVVLNRQVAFQVAADAPWTDVACPVALRFPQTDNETRILNFASDADMVFGAGTPATFNDQFNGCLKFTDTGALLTTGRNVQISTVTAGYRFHAWNATAKTLTIEGPSGSGVALTTGQQCDVYTDGTNVVASSAAF